MLAMHGYRVWILSFMISFGLHISFVFFMLIESSQKSVEQSGLSGKLSDSFQSVMIVSDLPEDELKKVSINQKKSMKAPVYQQKQAKQKQHKKDSNITKDISQEANLKVAKDISQDIESKSQNSESVAKSAKSAKTDSDTESLARDMSATAPRADSQKEVTTKAQGDKSSDKVSYQGLLSAHLNKHKRYPSDALAKEQEGVVIVRVTLDSTGRVLDRSIKKPCAFGTLNSEVLALFDRATPLPPPPSEMLKNNQVTLSLPIHYSLKKYYENR